MSRVAGRPESRRWTGRAGRAERSARRPRCRSASSRRRCRSSGSSSVSGVVPRGRTPGAGPRPAHRAPAGPGRRTPGRRSRRIPASRNRRTSAGPALPRPVGRVRRRPATRCRPSHGRRKRRPPGRPARPVPFGRAARRFLAPRRTPGTTGPGRNRVRPLPPSAAEPAVAESGRGVRPCSCTPRFLMSGPFGRARARVGVVGVEDGRPGTHTRTEGPASRRGGDGGRTALRACASLYGLLRADREPVHQAGGICPERPPTLR